MIALANGTGLGMMASETERTKIDDEGPESCCSDAAQQLSASAWVMARAEPESSESALCIGQDPPEQQAMRASDVASQPAHTATLLAAIAKIRTIADADLLKRTTPPKDARATRKCQISPYLSHWSKHVAQRKSCHVIRGLKRDRQFAGER